MGEAMLDDTTLHAVAARYLTFTARPLSYGTVRDYCDSFDNLGALATSNGDLKDLQRPWMFKTVLGAVGGRPARVLEIGAGEPIVADLLHRLGHDVWIVDPYDGSGNGPTEFERFRSDYAGLTFIREQFGERTSGLKPASFDCIYSISVLEHVPAEQLPDVMAGVQRYLRPDGHSIHAVDHVHRGRGAEEHLANLEVMAAAWGFSRSDLVQTLATMSDDVDTYYLSAESHNRWRGSVPYDEFPMRVCVSIHACRRATDLTTPGRRS